MCEKNTAALIKCHQLYNQALGKQWQVWCIDIWAHGTYTSEC